MATAWITYAWQDNQANDVTFIALELERMDIKIKLDRWNIQAGHRLWEKIDRFITDPKESDAWILFATANSLGSEACKEEFSYALLRGLNIVEMVTRLSPSFQKPLIISSYQQEFVAGST
jgi:hypothetical protein